MIVAVVARPDAHIAKPVLLVKPPSRGVRGPNLQGSLPRSMCPSQIQQREQQPFPYPLPPPGPSGGEGGHVGLVHEQPHPREPDDLAAPAGHQGTGRGLFLHAPGERHQLLGVADLKRERRPLMHNTLGAQPTAKGGPPHAGVRGLRGRGAQR